MQLSQYYRPTPESGQDGDQESLKSCIDEVRIHDMDGYLVAELMITKFHGAVTLNRVIVHRDEQTS